MENLPNHFFKDFELKNEIEKNDHIKEIDNMIKALPLINNNIRSNINLSIQIYKELNNFDRNYIHSIINDNKIKSK
jgi:hypothetical protein